MIRAGVAVAGVIGCDAIRAQIDAQRAVIVNAIAAQGIACAAQHANARCRAVADGQILQGTARSCDEEAVGAGRRSGAVNAERAAGLRRSVDDHGIGNGGQRAAQVDRIRRIARQVELNLIRRSVIGPRIGRIDRLPQFAVQSSAGAIVGIARLIDREDGAVLVRVLIFIGADVAGQTDRPRLAALIGRRATSGCAGIDRRAVARQGMRQRPAAIVLQPAELWIGAVAIARLLEPIDASRITAEVVTSRGEGAHTIAAAAIGHECILERERAFSNIDIAAAAARIIGDCDVQRRGRAAALIETAAAIAGARSASPDCR